MEKVKIKRAIKALTEARNLITHGHTTGAYARDVKGHVVGIHDRRACNFCVAGAIARVTGARPRMDGMLGGCADYSSAEDYLLQTVKDMAAVTSKSEGITVYNDRRSTTAAQMASAFDFAILLAKDDLKRAKVKKKRPSVGQVLYGLSF